MADVLDVVVIGGGIVGLATAHAVRTDGPEPALHVAVVEKEDRVAAHQSGRNSNVLHSGIYYAPGSLKARTVAAGRNAMLAFCARHELPINVCGKVIVAVRNEELPRLDALVARAEGNGVPVDRLGPAGLREVEPHATGIAALHVRSAAVVDFAAVCRALAAEIGDVRLSTAVVGLDERADHVIVSTTKGELAARVVVNCAGLQSDRVAAFHAPPDVRIVPFRGEYYALAPSMSELVRTMIYPVPDPALPFLGVHLTKGLDGSVHCGPNAVLPLGQLPRVVTYRGFRTLARRHWRTGVSEIARSWSRRRFAASLQRLVPEVDADDLVPAPAGVRAQAVAADGALLDDFVIRESARIIDVLNAPSPAATAALEIGRVISRAARDRVA